MSVGLTILVVALVFFVVAGVVVVLGVAWASRRGHLRRARLHLQVEGASNGSRRQLAQCQIDLDRALTDARQAVGAIGAAGAATVQLDLLMAQLDGVGGRLRQQLGALSGVSDRNLDRMLPPLASSVGQVGDIGDQLASAAGLALAGAADGELRVITEGASDALAVLDHRVVALGELD